MKDSLVRLAILLISVGVAIGTAQIGRHLCVVVDWCSKGYLFGGLLWYYVLLVRLGQVSSFHWTVWNIVGFAAFLEGGIRLVGLAHRLLFGIFKLARLLKCHLVDRLRGNSTVLWSFTMDGVRILADDVIDPGHLPVRYCLEASSVVALHLELPDGGHHRKVNLILSNRLPSSSLGVIFFTLR